jgi:coenzyme PQQ precursor peptide PqqA
MAACHDKYVMPHINAPLRRFWSALVLVSGPLLKMRLKGNAMVWTTPTLVEICIGLEINGYLPAEF